MTYSPNKSSYRPVDKVRGHRSHSKVADNYRHSNIDRFRLPPYSPSTRSSPCRYSRGSSSVTSRSYTRRCEDLPLEWWERNESCKEAKSQHLARIDELCDSREQLVRDTTLWKEDIALELNMFPYETPHGISHYTLWSIRDLNHEEIVEFVDRWLEKRYPRVRRWQYDDNSGERSISLFHVHVFVEHDPYSFTPRPGLEYFPPHVRPPNPRRVKSSSPR